MEIWMTDQRRSTPDRAPRTGAPRRVTAQARASGERIAQLRAGRIVQRQARG